MNWRQPSPYHLESACGQYTVSRAWINGGWIYDAWSRHTRPATSLHTGVKADCIAACDRHVAQYRGAAT